MIKFEKYSASGNNFILFRKDNIFLDSILLRHKLTSKECLLSDGIIFFNRKEKTLKVFNKDGSLALTCGNALRIAASILKDKKAGFLKIGRAFYPYFKEEIGFKRPDFIEVNEKYAIVNVPNPHYLILDYQNELTFETIDKKILKEYNVSIISVLDKNNYSLITHELGVGVTLSCGSATIASFTYLNHLDLINHEAIAHQKGGDIRVRSNDTYLFIKGEVKLIMKGKINEKVFKRS